MTANLFQERKKTQYFTFSYILSTGASGYSAFRYGSINEADKAAQTFVATHKRGGRDCVYTIVPFPLR
jgi:hypothetical protein